MFDVNVKTLEATQALTYKFPIIHNSNIADT
jgi:hypothetical protein